MNEFLNRLENVKVPNEYKDLIKNLKPLLSSDSDLNETYCADGLKIGFSRIGTSASMHICSELDDFENPLLILGF